MEVGQFLYTRLDKSESPRRIDGFQMVALTKTLISEAMVEEIEWQLRFHADAAEPQLSFHPVAEQHVVLMQLKAVVDKDRCGRSGNFLAHGVVLTNEQLAALGGNPLTLATVIPFVEGAAEAKQQGDVHGALEALRLPAGDVTANCEVEEPSRAPDLRKLLLLALSAIEPSERSRPVVLHGPIRQRLATLRTVFELLPQDLRRQFSFATHCCRVDPQGSCFQGFAAQPSCAGNLQIDVLERDVDAVEYSASSFSRWVQRTVALQSLAAWRRCREAGWQRACFIDARQPAAACASNAEVDREFWQANKWACHRRLLTTYVERVGESLTQRALPWLPRLYSVSQLFEQMYRGGCDLALAEALHAAYCDSVPPCRDEQRALRDLLRRRDDERLQAWLAAARQDWRLFQGVVRQLPEPQLAQVIRSLSNIVDMELPPLVVADREVESIAAILHAPRGGDALPLARALLRGDEVHKPLSMLSAAQLAKLSQLVLGLPRLFANRTRQAVWAECEQRTGKPNEGKRAKSIFSWWRS